MFQSGNYRLVAPINWEVQNDIKLHQHVLEKEKAALVKQLN